MSVKKNTYVKIDETDIKILLKLQENGRITNVQLANDIGLSPAPTLERVKKLEQSGLIESYHAVVNAEKLGLGIIIFIEISLNMHQDANIELLMHEIEQIPEVIECYHITGDSDFLLKVYVESMNQYQQLIIAKLSKVPHIGKMISKVVLATVKKSMVLPLDSHIVFTGRAARIATDGE